MPHHATTIPSHDPATIERVAETLYRQHRARHGHAYAWGEWDRAGSLQDQYREDARKVIAAAQIPGHINAAVTTALTNVAAQIEAELICCDVYERLHNIPHADLTDTQRAEYRAHAICYWSEAARTLVLDATPKPTPH